MPTVTERVEEILALCTPCDHNTPVIASTWVRVPDELVQELSALLLMAGGQYVSNTYKRDIGNDRGLLYLITDLLTPSKEIVSLVDYDYVRGNLLGIDTVQMRRVRTKTGAVDSEANKRELFTVRNMGHDL